MKKLMTSTAVILTAFAMTACATNNVKPSYVSPSKYQSLDCQQLQSEYNRVTAYLANGVASSAKGIGSGIGIGLSGGFGSGGGWGIMPSVSVNLGQMIGSKNTEKARVLGEQEAVVQAAKFKNCPIVLK